MRCLIAKIPYIALAALLSVCLVALTAPSAVGAQKGGVCPCTCGCATTGNCDCAEKGVECPCPCGCATTGKCDCAEKGVECPCPCGCATTGKCDCAKKCGVKRACAPLKSAA